MQQAGLMNFIRTILIIVLIYYALKAIGKFILPIFLKRMMRNVEKKFNQQGGESPQQEPSVKEGETIIDRTPNQTKKSNDNVGEYVDFEEIE